MNGTTLSSMPGNADKYYLTLISYPHFSRSSLEVQTANPQIDKRVELSGVKMFKE